MITALALLVAAVAAGTLAPRLLRWVDATRADPLVLLVAWLLSVVGVLAASATGIALLLVPDHGAAAGALDALHHCWAAVAHGATPRTEELAGLLGTVLFLALLARFALTTLRVARRRAAVSRTHLSVLRVVARREACSPTTLWLDNDQPLAFSLAGRPGAVVATDGLARRLDGAEVAAVLAHERAHLRGRHHQLIAVVDALAAALPFLPLFRQAPVAVRELIELCADVVAVRACGIEAVRSALARVSAHEAPGGALAMARDGIELRIARLRRGIRPAGRVRRTLWCGLAATTAATLPIVTAASLLLGIAVIACPFTG
jgi:beta-lactamase regulating signal transducer with metallopeptidase domain